MEEKTARETPTQPKDVREGHGNLKEDSAEKTENASPEVRATAIGDHSIAVVGGNVTINNNQKYIQLTVQNGDSFKKVELELKDVIKDIVLGLWGNVLEKIDNPDIKDALGKIDKEKFFKSIVRDIRARCLLEHTYKDKKTVNAAKAAIKGTGSVTSPAIDRFYVFLSAKTKNEDGTKTLEYHIAWALNEFLQNLGIGCFWWDEDEDKIDGIKDVSDKVALGLAFSSVFVGLAFDTVTKQSDGKYVYNSLLLEGVDGSSYKKDNPNFFEYEASTFRQLMSDNDYNKFFINGGREDKLLKEEEFETYVPKSRNMFFFTYGEADNFERYPAINCLDNNSFISSSPYCNTKIAMGSKTKQKIREILKHIIVMLYCGNVNIRNKVNEKAGITEAKEIDALTNQDLRKKIVNKAILKTKITVIDRKMPWWRPAVSSLGFVALAVLFSFIVQNLECMQWGMMNTLYPSLNHLFNVIQWLPIILVVIVQAVFLIWWRIVDKERRDHVKLKKERDKKRVELAKVESRRATLCSIWGVLVPYLVFVVCVGISYAVN